MSKIVVEIDLANAKDGDIFVLKEGKLIPLSYTNYNSKLYKKSKETNERIDELEKLCNTRNEAYNKQLALIMETLQILTKN